MHEGCEVRGGVVRHVKIVLHNFDLSPQLVVRAHSVHPVLEVFQVPDLVLQLVDGAASQHKQQQQQRHHSKCLTWSSRLLHDIIKQQQQ